jgi:hypothetical protein
MRNEIQKLLNEFRKRAGSSWRTNLYHNLRLGWKKGVQENIDIDVLIVCRQLPVLL